MLAFTFSMAASRFDARRLLVVDEANAIGTTYLRADLLDEAARSRVKNLLREYVACRTQGFAGGKHEAFQEILAKSDTVQAELWKEASSLGLKRPNLPVYSLFISTVNELIDIHSKRVEGSIYARVPISVWVVLIVVAALGMVATGYFCGLTGKRQFAETVVMVVAFSIVFTLVVDLDRPQEGLVQESQQPLIDLSQKLSSHQ
ncbi:MAG TPA: hypothetical protein V6C72_11645 [Chroococcales cyanobacterium]